MAYNNSGIPLTGKVWVRIFVYVQWNILTKLIFFHFRTSRPALCWSSATRVINSSIRLGDLNPTCQRVNQFQVHVLLQFNEEQNQTVTTTLAKLILTGRATPQWPKNGGFYLNTVYSGAKSFGEDTKSAIKINELKLKHIQIIEKIVQRLGIDPDREVFRKIDG